MVKHSVIRAASAFPLIAAGLPALAEVPRVATDIAPVHSLVAQVMGDLGEPELIMRPGASPHGYSMRPSEARSLQDAGLVVWMGADLTPWLDGAIETLGPDADTLALLEVPGTHLLEVRQGATFDAHDHGHGHGAEDDHDEAHDDGHDAAHDGDEHAAKAGDGHATDHGHGHDAAAEESHAHDEAHESHADEDHAEANEDEHHSDVHAHGDGHGHDPHAWLDPDNAALWVGEIAAHLSALDPANAEVYAANATAAVERLEALSADMSATLAPVRDIPFVVFHDGYQYFEDAFGLSAAGAITLSDARAPSAARVQEVRDRVRELGAVCIGAEPQFDAGLVDAVAEGTGATIAVMDPIGVDLTPGPDLYPRMMRGLAGAMASCAVGN